MAPSHDATPATQPEKTTAEGSPAAPATRRSARDERDARRGARARRHGHRLVGYSRFMAAIPSLGLFVSAVALTIATLIGTIRVTIEVVGGHIDMQDMLVEYIEFADFFLLSIVLYIMSIGLYSLFIDDAVELPHWLEIHDLEDLKEKLVGVIVVVMGVFFLGRLIHGASALDLLCMGVGIGAVVLALAYFVRHVMVAHKLLAAHDDDDEDGAGDRGSAAPSTTPRP